MSPWTAAQASPSIKHATCVPAGKATLTPVILRMLGSRTLVNYVRLLYRVRGRQLFVTTFVPVNPSYDVLETVLKNGINQRDLQGESDIRT